MRIGTAALFLIASLAIVSCKKEGALVDTKPPACMVAVEKLDTCVHALSLCESETERPPVSRDPAQPSAAPPFQTQAEAAEFEPKVGETYVLSQGNQTVVMNPKPVADALRRFAKGSVCRFDPEGKVKIVGRRAYKMGGEEEIEYLVRYTRDPGVEALQHGSLEYPDAEPYECPDGTVFYLDDISILDPEEPDAQFDAAQKLLSSEKP